MVSPFQRSSEAVTAHSSQLRIAQTQPNKMSKAWDEYTHSDNEMIYEETYNLQEEQMEMLNTELHIAKKQLVSQRILFEDREQALQEEIARLKEQKAEDTAKPTKRLKNWEDYTSSDDEMVYEESFYLEKIQVLKTKLFNTEKQLEAQMMKAAATEDTEESVQKQLTETERDTLIKEHLSRTADLTNQFEKKEKNWQFEIDHLKGELSSEVKFRLKAEDERDMALVKLNQDMASQAAAAEDRERSLQKQLELSETKRDTLTKEHLSRTADLKNQFEKKEKSLKFEIDHLKGELSCENKFRLEAEGERSRTLVQLNQEMASQAAAAKHREDSLLQLRETVFKNQVEKEKAMKDEIDRLQKELSTETRSRLDAEHETVQVKLQMEVKTKETAVWNDYITSLKEERNNEVEKLCRQTRELSEELDKTKEKLTKSEEEKASVIRECVQLKHQIELKVSEMETEKEENATTTATLKKELEAARRATEELGLERQSLCEKTEELKDNLHKESEQKAEMAQKIKEMEKRIQETEESAVQASRTWETHKHCLLKGFHQKLQAKAAEEQALIKKIERLELTAEVQKTSHEQAMSELLEEKAAILRDAHELKIVLRKKQEEADLEKTSHEQAMAELLEEKAAILRDAHDLKIVLRKKQEEATLLREMTNVLEEELEKRRRKWYRKLLCH